MRPMRAIAGGALAAALLGSCVVRYVMGPRITGTCSGACDHYVECRGKTSAEVRAACLTECPQVFGDRESLMAFESLSCPNTVEFVEGPDRRPPGQPGPGRSTAAPARRR